MQDPRSSLIHKSLDFNFHLTLFSELLTGPSFCLFSLRLHIEVCVNWWRHGHMGCNGNWTRRSDACSSGSKKRMEICEWMRATVSRHWENFMSGENGRDRYLFRFNRSQIRRLPFDLQWFEDGPVLDWASFIFSSLQKLEPGYSFGKNDISHLN
jgi:hypothetical protein